MSECDIQNPLFFCSFNKDECPLWMRQSTMKSKINNTPIPDYYNPEHCILPCRDSWKPQILYTVPWNHQFEDCLADDFSDKLQTGVLDYFQIMNRSIWVSFHKVLWGTPGKKWSLPPMPATNHTLNEWLNAYISKRFKAEEELNTEFEC